MTEIDKLSQAIGCLQASVTTLHHQLDDHRDEVNKRLDKLNHLTEKNAQDLAVWRALRAAAVTVVGLGIALFAAVKGLAK